MDVEGCAIADHFLFSRPTEKEILGIGHALLGEPLDSSLPISEVFK